MPNSSPNRIRNGCLISIAIVCALTIGAISTLGAVAYVGAAIENSGPIALTEVDADWRVDGDADSSALGVAEGVLQECTPMTNGFNILFQHVWYNTMTSGYDERMWLEAPEGRYDSFGLYIWSNRIFLRDETGQDGYNNQVLVCDRTDWR